MPYNYYYGSAMGDVAVLLVIFLVAALAGGIVLYCLVFGKKKDGHYKGFMKWLYDFVHFRILTIEVIAKVLYLISAIAVTLTSFLQFANGLIGLLLCPLQIILGNILVRIVYEFSVMAILLVKNTNEINAKLKNQNEGGAPAQDLFSISLPASEKSAKPEAAKGSGSKFCSGCGKPLDANAKFCDGCGKKCE